MSPFSPSLTMKASQKMFYVTGGKKGQKRKGTKNHLHPRSRSSFVSPIHSPCYSIQTVFCSPAPFRLPLPPLPLQTASCAAIHRLEWERRKRRKVARKKGGGGGGLGPTKKAAFWDDVVGGREGRARLTCAHTIFLLFHFFLLGFELLRRRENARRSIPTDRLEKEMKIRELQNLEMFNLLFVNAAFPIAG